jgi:hypothetical protein
MTYNGEPLVKRLYRLDELVEMQRSTLRYARSFPPGNERNRHRHVATSLRILFRDKNWLRSHTPQGLLVPQPFRFGTNAGTPD